MPDNIDVVIISADTSNLSTARELDQPGLSYQLIEGSHRIGGRAYSQEIAPGTRFDLGCAWTTEPWTYGSYSCALPGQAHQRKVLVEPIDNKLFFAGEATTVGDHACCHGAFNSGRRAAAEIDAVLG